jgi:hypothetical protein
LQRAEERVHSSLVRGRWLGQIRLCEELLCRPPRREIELTTMSLDDRRECAQALRLELAQGRAANSMD